MLKIGKKVEVKAEQAESRYTLEYETEEKLLKVVRERGQLGWKDVQEHIASLSSISAAIIAEILQKIVANVQEDSLEASLAFIYKLITIPHDTRELRHFLKHKFRVEAELLLYLLWQKRDEALALYLIDVILDTYTAQLMLGDNHILKLWKKHISNRAAFLSSKERVSFDLEERGGKGVINVGQGFRRLVIPL